MFWGITLENGKKYTQTVQAGFHIAMAALETQSGGEKQTVGLMLEHEKAEFLICTLNSNKLQQQPLDLDFSKGEDITFYLTGKGVVHLTGYLTGEEGDEEEYDSDSDEVPQLVPMKSISTNKGAATSISIKRKSDQKESTTKKMKGSDSDDDDDSDDDESDSDEDSDRITTVSSAKGKGPETPKSGKQNKQQTPMQGILKTPNKESQKGGTPGQQKQGKQTPASPQTSGVNGTPGDQSAKKKKKKKKNKNKEGGDTSVSSPTTPKQKPQTPGASKTLPSGVVIQESQVGSGPEARPGRFVHVYYVGRFHKTNKQFDEATSGKPFKFRLGKGEVIKGWEDGLQGMKVGGKRKLTIPAAQAYGSKQMGPIPPNSTLVFDVELKAVS